MTFPTPDFIPEELNAHEQRLLDCARRGENCDLFDKAKADARLAELRAAEAAKPVGERREDVTLRRLTVREQAEAEGAPKIRAALIRFLALGGNADHPVDLYGVSFSGARITDPLNLQGCRGLRPLGLVACAFDTAPVLVDAAGQTINLAGSALPGLLADRLEITGGLLLRGGFVARGAVRISGAKVGGVFDGTAGRFLGRDAGGNALVADGLETGDNVFLTDGFEARGAVRLLGAKVGGDLACTGGHFAGAPIALHLQAAEIAGAFFWRGLTAPPAGRVDLTAARVGTLADVLADWPEGKFILDGFRYERIVGPTDYVSRRQWLGSQVPEDLETGFKPQPFEQLARVLREMGHAEDAKRIAILKERYQRDASWRQAQGRIRDTRERRAEAVEARRTAIDRESIARLDREIREARRILVSEPLLARLRWWMSRLFGFIIGYGYRPVYAVGLAVLFIAYGAFRFDAAQDAAAMVPNNAFLLKAEWKQAVAESPAAPYAAFHAKVPDYQRFNALVYSVDSFVPFVDLHQETAWIPQPEGKGGAALARLYLWVHIIGGWIITALFAASLTGLVQRDV